MALSSRIVITPLHHTFVAEVGGVDFTKPVPSEVIQELQTAIDKYGVLVFRRANLDDESHVAFAQSFGELEPTPAAKMGFKLRLPNPYIGDLANVDHENKLITRENTLSMLSSKGNETWHADMQYHPRRCKYSTLRAVELPPEGTGGETLYADSRTAYEDLSEEMKENIENIVVHCSLLQNRRAGAPELYKGVDPFEWPTSRWKLVYLHDGSGRKNLYVTSYNYCIEGKTPEESKPLLDALLTHASQPKYVHTVFWDNPGDMVMWDNTAVLHRATDGSQYRGKFRRDVRRTSCYDSGPSAWGENVPGKYWTAALPKNPLGDPFAD